MVNITVRMDKQKLQALRNAIALTSCKTCLLMILLDGDMTVLENFKKDQLPALLLLSKISWMNHIAKVIDNKSSFNEVFDALVSTSQNPIEAEAEESEASAAPSEASSAAADEIGFLDTWNDAATYEDLERQEREWERELHIRQQIEEYEGPLAADMAKKEKRLKEEAQKTGGSPPSRGARGKTSSRERGSSVGSPWQHPWWTSKGQQGRHLYVQNPLSWWASAAEKVSGQSASRHFITVKGFYVEESYHHIP